MRNFLALIGLLAILTGVGAACFFFGGYYSVSTTAYEPAIVRWALMSVREASVRRHANDIPPPSLDDSAMPRAGARAYVERGCVNCHGGPGIEWTKFSEGLRPDPPDLKEVIKDLPAAQLFWAIKNGINMTGMPGFGDAPDPEIWSIVAFLKKLPTISDEDFKSWTVTPAAAAKP